MDLFIILLYIILLIFYLYTVYISQKILKPFEKEIPPLHEFSTNVEFDEYPSDINVENKYYCNAKNLRVCDMDDPLKVLMGCKELRVVCKHFEKDTEYHENGEVSIIIEKNKNSNEGYALSVTSVAQSCNPYHGDLILVSLNKDSTEYMLICQCKNPGYIGNNDVLGNCTTPNICNGIVKDINKPLNKIECVCNDLEKNKRYDDGVPVCSKMNVNEANEKYLDWTDRIDWKNARVIEKNVFNATIAGNLNIKKLLDPCRNSILDSSIEIPNALYNYEYKTCQSKSHGLPIKNDTLVKSDFVYTDWNRNIKYNSYEGFIHTNENISVRLSDNFGGKDQIGALRTNVPLNDMGDGFYKLPPNPGFHKTSQLYFPLSMHSLAGYCEASTLTYNCRFGFYETEDFNGMPKVPIWSPPSWFLWNTELWTKTVHMIPYGINYQPFGMIISNKEFYAIDNTRNYGMQFCNNNIENNCKNGVLSFKNLNDYNQHKSILNTNN